jgi:RNA polymerase sigma factor (sigma-70 family)
MNEERADMQNEVLLEELRVGNRGAVARLYEDNYASVHNYIIRNQGDEEDAEEIYQQAFVILYEKVQDPAFRLNASVGTFLYAVARNLWLASMKERRRFTVKSEEDLEGTDRQDAVLLQDVLNREKEFSVMEQSLEMLGEPCHTLLKLFYHETLSMEQIAVQMGYTNADNAKTQKYKCLRRLRRIFDQQMTDKNNDAD